MTTKRHQPPTRLSPPHRTKRTSPDNSASGTSRPALVTIHPNIRRSRSRLALVANGDPDVDDSVPTGSKRKRVASGPENVRNAHNTSLTRSAKRQKYNPVSDSSEEDNDDAKARLDDADQEEEHDLDYYLKEAPSWKLSRLRKDRLLTLHKEANLQPNHSDSLTRHELIEALLNARKALRKRLVSKRADGSQKHRSARLPRRPMAESHAPRTPSSDENRQSLSAFDPRRNHVLKRFPTDIPTAFHRPPTVVGRSFSLNQLGLARSSQKSSARPGLVGSASHFTFAPPTPPATRNKKQGSRLLDKHVEFIEEQEEDEDSSELSEPEEVINIIEPSPRRLRSRSIRTNSTETTNSSGSQQKRLPVRLARTKVASLNEEETEDLEESESGEELPASSVFDSDDETATSFSSGTPEGPKRTRALRNMPSNRNLRSRLQTPPPEQTDDDDEEMEAMEISGSQASTGKPQSSPRRLRNGKVVVVDHQEEEEEEEQDASDVSMLSETSEDETVDGDGAKDDEDYVDSAPPTPTPAQPDEDEDDGGNEDGDEDVDLHEENSKSLNRYRRDVLVKLCENRSLSTSGTKAQLVKALLDWRDSRDPQSAPSSASTVRGAPDTVVPAKRNANKKKPVLERSDRIHISEPRTPPVPPSEEGSVIELVTHKDKNQEPQEGELEVDLEELGLEDKEIPYNRLTKLEKIGSGGFKDVYIGKIGKKKVAISEFRGQLTAMDVKELTLLRDFNHPNIVRFLGVSIPPETSAKGTPVMMISELCSNGDLFDYVRNVQPPSKKRVFGIMLDIARGLEYLHTHKPSVIHRDCKSSNILITSTGAAKIADFGLAKVKQSTRSMVRSLVGTVNWQAPELWHAHPRYDHKVDVFSCAMVFWEVLQWHVANKKYPWEGMNEHAIYEAVGTKRQRPSLSGLRTRWCPEIVSLVEKMWAQDPRDRPTMSEVVEELEIIKALPHSH